MWRRGDLSYALHEGQMRCRVAIADAESRGVRRVVLICARRFGKTRALVVDACETALRYPGARLPYAALTWESATEFVRPEIEALAADAPAELRPREVGGDWIFPNGSAIVLRGCEDRNKANRLRGPKAHRAYLDEAGFNGELDYVIKSVLSWQLLTTDGTLLIASSPPVSPGHALVGYVTDADARGALFRASIYDAPHVTDQQRETMCREMGGAQSTEWKREGLALFVTDTARAVIPEWSDHEEAIVREVDAPEHRDWYIIGDVGFVDLTVLLLVWYDFANDVIVIEDERRLVRPNSATIVAAARDMEAFVGASAHRRIVDATPFVLNELSSRGEYWEMPQKDDSEAAINALRLRVQRRTLAVHPRCQTTIAHARHGIWNRQRTEFERTADDGHYDALDALKYAVRSVVVSRNPTPPTPGHAMRQHVHYIPPQPKVPLLGLRLKRA
jgi:hypothetical protein